MMFRNYLRFLVIVFIAVEFAHAKNIIDCRVITSNTRMCNTYGSKLIHAKLTKHGIDTKKLIISKTLPVPAKSTVKVIFVEDMMEEYYEVRDPLRFRGSEKRPFKVTVDEKPVAEKLIKKKIEKINEIEVCKVTPQVGIELLESVESEQPQIKYGKYIVAEGDALSKIAKKFQLNTKALVKLNDLETTTICAGQELELPFEQNIIDAWVSAQYKVEKSDTLISIAKKFNLEPKELVRFNNISSNTAIRVGEMIKLPLPYVLEAKKKSEMNKKKLAAQKKSGRLNMLEGFGKNKLRVTATAYTSHRKQTDRSPFMAAWNNRLLPGMKIIAVSRDLLRTYGLRNGTTVRIDGLPGYYKVRDKMNKRYRKRIDIYTGVDRRKALRWGRRSVMLYW